MLARDRLARPGRGGPQLARSARRCGGRRVPRAHQHPARDHHVPLLRRRPRDPASLPSGLVEPPDECVPRQGTGGLRRRRAPPARLHVRGPRRSRSEVDKAGIPPPSDGVRRARRGSQLRHARGVHPPGRRGPDHASGLSTAPPPSFRGRRYGRSSSTTTGCRPTSHRSGACSRRSTARPSRPETAPLVHRERPFVYACAQGMAAHRPTAKHWPCSDHAEEK